MKTQISLSDLDTNTWRQRFSNAYSKYKKAKHGKLYKALATIDPYYDTGDGSTELRSIIANRGGLKVVAKATQTLEKFLESQTTPKP